MRVLDLFSGLGGWSQAFVDRGHEVLRIDNDEAFLNVPWTSVEDVLTFRPRDHYDVVLASPPCQAFSLAATGTHMLALGLCKLCSGPSLRHKGERWECARCGHDRILKGSLTLEPKTEFGDLSVALVDRALELIRDIQPRYWWLENPNGGMIHFVPREIPRVQVTYCRYGEDRQKLTNLWGSWPETWHPRPRCANGSACHERAPRGAKTGTQGIAGSALRSLVPYELSLEVCRAVEGSGLR